MRRGGLGDSSANAETHLVESAGVERRERSHELGEEAVVKARKIDE